MSEGASAPGSMRSRQAESLSARILPIKNKAFEYSRTRLVRRISADPGCAQARATRIAAPPTTSCPWPGRQEVEPLGGRAQCLHTLHG